MVDDDFMNKPAVSCERGKNAVDLLVSYLESGAAMLKAVIRPAATAQKSVDAGGKVKPH